VLQLDLPRMIAGAKERGELESRVTRLVAELREDKNAILMWVMLLYCQCCGCCCCGCCQCRAACGAGCWRGVSLASFSCSV
jgi:hypothetical protein